MSIREKLASLNIDLPRPGAPAAAFSLWVQSGDLLFLSGHIALREGEPWVGVLGAGMTTAEGAVAARGVAIDLLGTLAAAAGDLDRVQRIVKLLVLVNSAPSFTEQHLVANGASELLIELYGQAPARSAFGVAQLPLGACVEIELIAQLRA